MKYFPSDNDDDDDDDNDVDGKENGTKLIT